MARPPIDNLEYFPVNTKLFFSRLATNLKARFGTVAVGIYLFLLCQIYGEGGYYLTMDDDMYYIIADYFSIETKLVKEVMEYFLHKSVFDKEMFENNILTSAEIQNVYQHAVKGRSRRRRIVIRAYWLLSVEDTEEYMEVLAYEVPAEKNDDNGDLSTDKPSNNDSLSANISTNKKKGNETEGDDTIVDKNKYFNNDDLNEVFLQFLSIRTKKYGVILEEQITMLINELNDMEEDVSEKIKIVKKAAESGWKSFYSVNQNKKGANTSGNGMPNRFHNFEQREYDFEALENQMIKKVNSGQTQQE